ncbi:pachytene checkpoint protein 2 homolog [Leptopilina heterotoma]|uniref:pachytene checkpoint protein 2 homolog n=1 Tax=Leptopilina heterotoma TaxID=63436 RepID=UPI001CA8F5DE|nr:pachytene checkpoint protein 2 homolog [Leptopilina heterotoma]
MDSHDIIHVEICQKDDSMLSRSDIEEIVRAELSSLDEITLNVPMPGEQFSKDIVKNHVQSVICSCSNPERTHMKIHSSHLKVYVYRLTEESAATETIRSESDEMAAASHWILPSTEFHGLWENLIYESDIKEHLLHFVETTMLFSDRKVDPNIISWNKVILLHGPPGTGKTSLCKALAQKAAIRLGNHYTHGELIEINSHSLFSKWFSESGKLVMKLFDEVKNLLEDPKALVCVLIDEVESLAHMRKSCTNGTEPSDAIRVVNALLTQLDQIKKYSNVIILTTSNVTEAIDLAFIDRADLKQLIGLPSEQAIYKIYHSCIKELMRTGFLETEALCDIAHLKKLGYEENSETKHSLKLLELSKESVGMSGRVLRKIPFLAHALYTHSAKCPVPRFFRAMHLAVEKQKEEEIA